MGSMTTQTADTLLTETSETTGTGEYGSMEARAGAVVAEIREHANADSPLLALELIATRLREQPALQPYLEPLRTELRERTKHLASLEVYRDFYNDGGSDRWTPDERVVGIHQTMPRWGIVRQQMELQQQRRVVELGCADGFNLLNYALAYRDVQCVGVDVNGGAIAEAQRKTAVFGLSEQCRFVQSLVEDVDLPPESFDAVLVQEILEHVIDPEPVLAKAETLVTPGGWVYVSAPLSAPPHTGDREKREHVRLFTADRMRGVLSDGTRELVWYCQIPSPGFTHHCGAYRRT